MVDLVFFGTLALCVTLILLGIVLALVNITHELQKINDFLLMQKLWIRGGDEPDGPDQ